MSSAGEIRSKEGKTTHSVRHGKRVWKQRILKQKVGKDNCCRVSLWRNKEERTWLVHRVVAKAFIPRVEGKNFINHKDGSRLNNEVPNLEWCTPTENNNHAFDTGLIGTAIKTILDNERTGEQLVFRSMTKAGEHLGYSHGYISDLLRSGKTEVDGYRIKTS